MSRGAKITVTVPSGSLRHAKAFAKREGKSLSAVVAKLLQSLGSAKEAAARSRNGKSPKITQSSVGLVALPPGEKADLLSDAIVTHFTRP